MPMSDGEYLQKLGAAIVKRRKELGLSQADLAYRIDMDVPNLSIIENGKTNPHILTLVRLSAALDVNLSDLLPKITNLNAFLEQTPTYSPIRRKKD
jgi:transcriptional regulator with XRE-family HTH domain